VRRPFPRVSLGLLTLGESPHGHVVLHHGALIGAMCCLAIGITAESNSDPLGALLLSLFATFGASLRSLASRFGHYPTAATGDRLSVTLDENGPDHLLTKGVPDGHVKQRVPDQNAEMTLVSPIFGSSWHF
jgi:hypothetical protein